MTAFYKYTSRQGSKETLMILGLPEGALVFVPDEAMAKRLQKKADGLGRGDIKYRAPGKGLAGNKTQRFIWEPAGVRRAA